MLKRSIEQIRDRLSPRGAQAERETSRRTMHGGTAWTAVAAEENAPLYQPQDSPSGERKALAAMGEPEDARLTGGTRSLMRRLSGLNLRPARRLAPVTRTTASVV